MKHAPKYTIKVDTGLITIIELKKKLLFRQPFDTIKSRAVDWSTIQFWTLLDKGHSTQASKFPFINSLKILESATNRDRLLLAILWYIMKSETQQHYY